MKIAMFTDHFFPELGGIQDSIATISRALGQRGHQVDIYAPRYGDARLSADRRRRCGNATWAPMCACAGGLPCRFPVRRGNPARRCPRRSAGRRWRWAREPDVIHAHSFFGIGLEALLNGACLRIPVIGTNHWTVAGFGPHIPVSVDNAAAYVTWFYNRCDYVTAPSRSVFEELGTDAAAPAACRGVQSDRHRPVQAGARGGPRCAARAVWPDAADDHLCRPARAGEEHRGAAARRRGAARSRHRRGPRNRWTRLARTDTACAGGRVANRCDRSGSLARWRRSDLARLLRISDTFAIMSTSETQSMVLLQAMASGVPVVAANSRALPEFVVPANGVLVDPHDVSATDAGAGGFAGLAGAAPADGCGGTPLRRAISC